MSYRLGLILTFLSFSWCFSVSADPRTHVVTIDVQKRHLIEGKTISSQQKSIEIPAVDVTPNLTLQLQQRLRSIQQPKIMSSLSDTLPVTQNLGMNHVPVLDQGRHGSCVTFALTATIDAELYANDTISQLCVLELGLTLEQANRGASGWHGTTIKPQFNRLKQYGIIDKQQEKEIRCGGLSYYPTNQSTVGKKMSVSSYLSHSLDDLHDVTIKNIYSSDPEVMLANVKRELAAGHRVVIGIYLDVQASNMGFVGKHQTWIFGDTLTLNDTLVDKITNKRLSHLGGHAMLIHGYDDQASVDGQPGLLHLRNSWGNGFGDKGDAYVTYDYFKLMNHDAYAIIVP